MPDKPLNTSVFSPMPYRFALLLACLTFPLIWIGGMVTSTDSGMAVPDWPTTYGYNMFLYPWETWFFGPWDLFIEHGHRLFATVVGLITIALVVVLYLRESRGWVRILGVLALIAVIAQGILGGMRVVQNEVLLAKIHGCFGPAFFMLTVALAVVTSRIWLNAPNQLLTYSKARTLQRLTISTTFLAFVQLVLGANLRHLMADSPYQRFQITLIFHLVLAAVLVLHGLLITKHAWGLRAGNRRVWLACCSILFLLGCQVLLGFGAYITHYAWPVWAQTAWNSGYVILARSGTQVHSTTAHVAVGSLILAASTVASLLTFRLLQPEPHPRTLKTSIHPTTSEAVA